MQCSQVQPLIIPYLEDIKRRQEKKPELFPLDKKAEFARHICSCPQCHEELEFYLIVYVTTDMLDDTDIPDNYKDAVDELLEDTKWEAARALHQARTGRFRLIAILIVLAIALSLSVGRSAVEPEPEVLTPRLEGFYLGDLGLPKEIDFVDNAIAAYHDGARDFVFSQRIRAAQVDGLWRADVELMRAMRPEGVLTYVLPTSFLLSEGSFAARLEAAKKPEILYQPTLTLRPFPHAQKLPEDDGGTGED
ncbi:MAG: hypothetical protein K2P87_10020 [Lachnospiraceae bacterium]|nr:hypothetical protein [Lachnospiraceae bacterium]